MRSADITGVTVNEQPAVAAQCPEAAMANTGSALVPYWKRPLDVVLAGVGLAVCAVPMAMVAVAIRAVMGRPVLFRIARPGLRGQPFVLLKFRTMRNSADAQGRPLSDVERITRLGRFLRRTSLDELPQLINVWRGEMSIVGPRPLKMEYLPLYTPAQARRHDVRPGITGLAQINGRNALSWERRFVCDVQYVSEMSLRLDLTILAHTAWRLVAASTVREDGDLDVPSFTGSATDGSWPVTGGDA